MAKILQGMNTQGGNQVATQVRDYTPGSNDFLSFANTMNNNAQLDMKKAHAASAQGGTFVTSAPGVPASHTEQGAPSTPLAQPRAIGSAAYGNIRSNFKKILDDSAKGIETRYESYFKNDKNGGII